MAVALAVEVRGEERVVQNLDATSKDIDDATRRGVERAAQLIHKLTRERFTSGSPGVFDRERITSRSGDMLRSLGVRLPVTKKGNAWQTEVGYRKGVVDSYVRTHESSHPVTIRPKRGSLLAIPLPAALAKSGRRSKSADLRTEYPQGVWISRQGRPPIFVIKRATRFDLLFVGKKSVTIRPRRPLFKTFEQNRSRVQELIDEEIGRVTRRRG